MAQLLPQPGQVIRYGYCGGANRALAEDSAKDRPCGVMLTRITKAGNTVAYVVPITHTPPHKDEDRIEIPQATSAVSDWMPNGPGSSPQSSISSPWPGPDIRPTASGEYNYGCCRKSLCA